MTTEADQKKAKTHKINTQGTEETLNKPFNHATHVIFAELFLLFHIRSKLENSRTGSNEHDPYL